MGDQSPGTRAGTVSTVSLQLRPGAHWLTNVSPADPLSRVSVQESSEGSL